MDCYGNGHRNDRNCTVRLRQSVDVKVLVSFLASESPEDSIQPRQSGKTSTQAIHKEKFDIPIYDSHAELQAFEKHITEFTDLKQIALSKGLGQNPGVTLVRINKNPTGGIDVYSIRTQAAWQHEFPHLMNDKYRNAMLQATDSSFRVPSIQGVPKKAESNFKFRLVQR